MLRPLHAIPVENGLFPGTPDVNYAGGWIELKKLLQWPKSCNANPVRVGHFTPQQRMWLRKRWEAKPGSSWLLIQIENVFLLLEGHTAAEILGNATRPELEAQARAVWTGTINEPELIKCLSNPSI